MDEETRKGLETVAGRLGWKVIDYASDDGFDWLWSELDLNEWLKGDGARNLLVVWDDMPLALDMPPVNISAELTPLDWIVSISHHLLQRDAPPALRVVILDGHSFRMPAAFGCRMAESLIASLPWLGVVRLLPNGKNRSVADGWDEVKLKTILGTPSEIETLAGGAYRAVVESFVQAWTGNLARAASHHDVNNLLGPILLLESFGARPTKHRGRDALLEHARRLGLAPTGEMIDDKAWFDAQGLARTLGRPIRFVLVDDQVNNGWGNVIATALGILSSFDSSPVLPARADAIECLAKGNGVEVWATASADPVIEALNDAVKTGTDHRFRLRLTPWDSKDGPADNLPLEVLLLDLRLASGDGEKIAYFNKVLDLAEILVTGNIDGCWPWRPVINVEHAHPRTLKDLRDQVHNYDNASNVAAQPLDTIDLDLLTLLARVIATIDLSLPIIVFSSTGQRSVTEEFKGYGNIITAFEKPRLLGYRSEDPLRETKSKWTVAIEQAADVLRGRSAVQRICNESAPKPQTALQAEYVEVFIDESGSPGKDGFTVGGLILLYADKDVKSIIDQKINDTEIEIDGQQCKLRWDGVDALDKRFRNNKFKTLEQCVFPTLNTLYSENGITAIPFALRAKAEHDRDNNTHILSNPDLDNLYMYMTKEVIDAVLYEIVPWYSLGSLPEIAIYAATRVRVAGDTRGLADRKRLLFENFGILTQVDEEEVRFCSVRPDSFIPLVADAMRNRPNSPRPTVRAVVGVPINVRGKDGIVPAPLDYLLDPVKQLPWYAAQHPKPLDANNKTKLAIVEVGEEIRSVRRNGVQRDVPVETLKARRSGGGVYEDYKRDLYSYADGVSHLRQSHFVADLVAHTAYSARRDPNHYKALASFTNRMLDDLDESGFEFAIDASKCLEAGDRPGALIRATATTVRYTEWKRQYPVCHEDSVVPRILTKIAGCLPDLTGEEFLIYCRSICDWVIGSIGATANSLPRRTRASSDTQRSERHQAFQTSPAKQSHRGKPRPAPQAGGRRTPDAPWRECISEQGANGHHWTVVGFDAAIDPEGAARLVVEYLTEITEWQPDTAVEGNRSKKNPKNVICRIFNLPGGALNRLPRRRQGAPS